MSRCFSYPPSGYVRNGACAEALIESIKLQREKEKARPGRKKDKKREKKQRKSENCLGICHGKKLSDDSRLKGESDLRGRYPLKSSEAEVEPLENSTITEEHDQPICSQNVSESSDSTHSSYKRKRETSHSIHNRGTIIRIRLPLQMHKSPDASISGEQICSNSGWADSLSQPKISAGTTQQKGSTCINRDTVGQEIIITSQTSTKTGIFACDGVGAASGSTFRNEKHSAESLYEVLVENWVPPLLDQTDFDDQDWLFGTKQQGRDGTKKYKASNSGLNHWSPTSWPCTHYLPEADIFALPFTVPF